MEKTLNCKIFLGICLILLVKRKNIQYLRAHRGYGIHGHIFLALSGRNIREGFSQSLVHIWNAHRAEEFRIVFRQDGGDARKDGGGYGEAVGEGRENGLLRSFIEGRKYVERGVSVQESDFFFIEHVVYMYVALETELYQGGPYLVVGGIFPSNENDIDDVLVFLEQETICLQESGYILVLPEFSHGEDVSLVDTFLREELFRFILL